MNATMLIEMSPICVIAGRGDLPVQVCAALQKASVPYRVLAIKGRAGDSLSVDGEFALDKWTPVLKNLRDWGICSVVFAGKIDRPSILSLKPDMTLIKYLPRLGLSSAGDDGVMRAIIGIFQDEFDLTIISPQQILCPEPNAQDDLGQYRPNAQDKADIVHGVHVLRALSAADFGQATAIEGGVVLAVEAIEGTDQMISRAQPFRQSTESSGVIVKMHKVQQDTRIDVPTIGVQTIRTLHAAGFRGIAISAEHTLIIDHPAVIALADELQIFIRQVRY